MKTTFLPVVYLTVALTVAVRAELLVYEGFDPSDPSANLQAGQVAGATSKGFAADSKWAVIGSDDFVAETQGEGLGMEGLASVGGSLKVGNGGSSRVGTVNVFRRSGVSIPSGSTVFGSFLFQNNQTMARYVTALAVETGEDLPDDKGVSRGAHSIGDNDAATIFTISPDSFARDEEGVPGRATQGIKVGKYASHGSKEMAQAEYELPNLQTFLVVWSVVNAAGSEPATAGSQQVVMWILSPDNLKTIRAAGEPSPQSLDSNNLVRVVVDKGLRARLLDSDFINILAGTAGGAKASSSVYDEIRIGTDMASVLPAP